MIKGLRVRERTEAREESLSPFARQSARSEGRLKPEESDCLRTCFQRDRDRILHTKAFRRLKHKTQVFIAPLGDHFVTRLTHTLEVSQVARTIARALNLNEDLAEAISLGHDLGHTPFGHIGEDTLNELFEGGFHHNEQSLRVVDVLENDGQGLNLTREVRDGILNHSKGEMDIFSAEQGKNATYEAEIVKIADAIAYINHDIGDAIRAGIISEGDLPVETISMLGCTHSQRVNTMICDIVENSWAVTGTAGSGEIPVICMSPRVAMATEGLRRFMFQRVYKTVSRRVEAEHARSVVGKLYNYFTANEYELPPEYRDYGGEMQRRVVDYIAGMTDQYALRLVAEHNL